MNKYLAPFKNLVIFYLIINLLLRIILFFHPITQSSFTILEILKIVLLGMLSDFFIFIVTSAFLWLYLLFLSNSKLKQPWGYILLSIYAFLFIYIASGKSILNEYGGVLPEIGLIFVGIKTVLIGLLVFIPNYRKIIRLLIYSFTIFLFSLLIIQNAVSEFFFWNEFGLKYNFIAVDYLVYTNTVIGNIMESYPVIPLFTCVGILTLIATYFIVKNSKIYLDNLPSFKTKIKILGIYGLFFILSLFIIPGLSYLENSKNLYTNELQANGIFKFYLAFKNSELDYYQFYNTIKNEEAFALLQKQLPQIEKDSSTHTITNEGDEIKKNVVLITIESLSASFMKMYGNQQNLTPFLDSLALQSLNFSNLYATGNRTVRGLEAVTLCIPSTPGESVVKREDNKNKFCTGSIFKSKGYDVKYLYGGDAYFDNMNDFFVGNGYDVIDKNSFTAEEISFSNIWGVCDEDMAKKAIQIMNKEAQTGKPFFNHWMTVSNHRPFTYPDGKISISCDSKSREGGVKYTDYALRQFFVMAEKQSWFKNTIFVIVADHCASSSGKTELPLDKYRIPAMVYAPGFISPKNENILMSQIDLMPTVFGLLHFNYQSKFFGQDIMKNNYQPRAFIATYEDLGYIKNNTLTIISPVKKQKQFDLKLSKGNTNTFELYYDEIPKEKINTTLATETISFYQSAAYLLKNKKYQKL
ncbi:LTA synthase family protein [Flavobacterium sp. J27]|uniref:LTA synthase family protein n=1 Tax=Flavobacterium sp. J27 TaxID=2060419 RepID=UPI0010312021|nr:LTA synthase family protein [Flavobacterium sp. J27]